MSCIKILNTSEEKENVEKIHDLMGAIERQELVEVIKVSNNGITVRIGKENQIKLKA